jgi:ABC-type branched-subunit amino acid transport system substrate-binding protein
VKSLLALGYAEIGTLLVQAKAIGLSAQIYTLATVESPDILAIAGEATTGVEYPEWKAVRTPVFKEFRKAFIARTGRAPFIEVSTVPSYDIAVIIATALNTETEKTTSVVPKLKNAFYSLKDYPGVSGPITMDPDGVVRSFTVRMGKIQR